MRHIHRQVMRILFSKVGCCRRLGIRLVLVIGLTASAALIFAAPAHAFDLCKDAPAPVAPKTGLPGLLTAPPAEIPSSAPDPFTNPKIAIGDVYGYNWHWSNYDLGCGSDFLRDPGAVTNTASGNILLSIADGMTAALASLEQMAKGLPLEWLTAPVNAIATALQEPILSAWFPIATLVLAVLVLWRAKKAPHHETAKTVAVFAAAVALATFALLYPAALSSQVDKVVTTTARVTGSPFSASATDAVNRESGYRTWLAGSFGDPDSQSAKEYGPRLMSATHYTWSDWQRIQRTPAAKDIIDQAKAAEFKKIAQQLEDKDPAAYEVFTGRGERTGPALFGILNVAAMGLFVGMAALMVLASRVMMQGLTLIAPLAAVVGILPRFHGALARLWDLFTAAVIAVAKFTLAGGVMTMVLGAVQGADISGAGRLFFVVVATAVGIVLTKPVRSLKTIVPGLNPDQSYVKKLIQHVGPALAGGAGSYAGVFNGTQDASQRDQQPTPSWTPTATASMASLSAPTVTVIQEPPAEAQQPRRPEVVAATAPIRALPAPPLALSAAPSDVEQANDAARPSTADGALPAPSAVEDGTSVRQPPAEPESVWPTALIVKTDPAEYHPGGPAEVYIPASELQLAEDGREHDRIVYHSNTEV